MAWNDLGLTEPSCRENTDADQLIKEVIHPGGSCICRPETRRLPKADAAMCGQTFGAMLKSMQKRGIQIDHRMGKTEHPTRSVWALANFCGEGPAQPGGLAGTGEARAWPRRGPPVSRAGKCHRLASSLPKGLRALAPSLFSLS